MEKKTVKLVVTDLDDTLLAPDKSISEAAVAAIRELGKKNIGFTFITGRPPYAVSRFAKQVELSAPLVCCNGAIICDANNTYHMQTFPISGLKSIMENAANSGMTVLLYDGKTEYALAETQWTKIRTSAGRPVPILDKRAWLAPNIQAVKMNILSGDKTTLFETTKPALLALKNQYSITMYGNTGCEIVAPHINKATGLAKLCKLLNINTANVLAVGDNENDNEMLKEVGVGAAVANAVNSTKLVADYVCKQGYTAGVVEAIEKFAL